MAGGWGGAGRVVGATAGDGPTAAVTPGHARRVGGRWLPGLLLAVLLAQVQVQAQVPAQAVAPAQDAAFQRCLAAMQPQAAARGIDAASFARLTPDLRPDRSVLPLLNAQPEFTTPIWDYLAGLVDQQRVDDGRAMLEAHRELLARIAREYGVDAETVVAVWGVESDFGRVTGKRPLRVSLATLACEGRRQEFFRGELLALLSLLASGDLVDPDLTGSWAGAFGQTQFMPSTYARIAVDGDGDGRRDLVASIPDALASTANYLKRAGWRSGQPWGYEVKLPPGYRIEIGGAYEESGKANESIAQLLPMAAGVMLVLLMFQLQSFPSLFLVLTTAPLGLIGAAGALLLFDQPFGFVAMLGVLALAGMIMRNTVILVDQIGKDIEEGMEAGEAVIDATIRRTRPVVLTALAAILAMIPLSRNIFWGPMAVAIMGGLFVATALTLLFTPALYAMVFRINKPRNR